MNGNKKKKAFIVAASAFLIVGLALSIYLFYRAYHISTDDAFIEADMYTVAPKISGSVEEVLVEDNQRVNKGDVLVQLNADDFTLRVRSAEASLTESQAKLRELEAKVQISLLSLEESKSSVEASRASLELKNAVLRKAEQDFNRAKTLFEKNVFSKERYDNAVSAHDVAKADSRAAQENFNKAEQAMKVKRAAHEQTQFEAITQQSRIERQTVALETARLYLGYTSILAPADGYVTRKNVGVGTHVKVGQPLMALVDLDNVWIVANYKETELGKIKPGLPVDFEVDTWPGVSFHGSVESIMAGTGAAFSVFPSENATGNYVKIVQRIPVKIVPDENTFGQYRPRVGMSVVPVINLK